MRDFARKQVEHEIRMWRARNLLGCPVPRAVVVTLSEGDARALQFHPERVTVPRLFTSRRAVDYPASVITLEGAS